MARTFNSTTDLVVGAFTGTSTLRTYSIWTLRTGGGASGVGRMFEKDSLGNSFNDLFFNEDGTTTYKYVRAWSVASGGWTIPQPSLSVWHHLAIVYDAGSTANDPVIYLDGVSQTVTRTDPPSGTITNNSDAYVLGNRSDAGRGWAGDVAEFAIYNRLLNANEVKGLYLRGPGALPDYVAWTPLWGVASPEPEFRASSASSATVTGMTRANHPPTRIFSRRFWNVAQPEPAVAAGQPTMRRFGHTRFNRPVEIGHEGVRIF